MMIASVKHEWKAIEIRKEQASKEEEEEEE